MVGRAGQGLEGGAAGPGVGKDLGRPSGGGERGHDEDAGHFLLGGIGAEGAGHAQIEGKLVPVAPQGLVRGIGRAVQRPAHFVGIAPAGLDLEPAAGDLAEHAVVFRGFSRAGMKADADPKLPAYVPLPPDHGPQGGVVGIGRVLLKAERGGDKVHRHAQPLAQGEHDGRGFRRRQAGKLVDGKLAQVPPANVGGKGRVARRAVFPVAPLHLDHRGPHEAEQPLEFRGLQHQPDFRDAGADLPDQFGGDGRQLGRLVQRQFGREVKGDVTGQEAAPHQGVLPAVELAANGLVVGVETPGQPAAMEPGFQLGQHRAVAHSLHALSLMPLGDIRPDEREGNGVEPALQHGVQVKDELPRDAVLISRHPQIQHAHRPFDGGPVQRGETCPDADRAAGQVSARGGKNRRVGIVGQDQVLETKQVFPRGGKGAVLAINGDTLGQNLPGLGARGRVQDPGAITGLAVLKEHPAAIGRDKAALGQGPFGQPGAQLWNQGRPIEAKIGADARILRDAQVML